MEYEYLPIFVEGLLTVTVEYAQEHTVELLERVNRENITIIIRDAKGAVMLVPYWWHCLAFGTDPKRILEVLFEESKWADDTEILKITGIAQGYINLTSPDVAQNILEELLPQVDAHPHASHWHSVLDKLAKSWDIPHEPKVLFCAFTGDRKVYLLFTDGQTRLVDMRAFIGRGLEEADLRDEAHFRNCLTVVTEALVWMEAAGTVRATFSSEELLQANEPVEEAVAREIWATSKDGVNYHLRTT